MTTTPPCPCECSTGGFCGGCGHAGCGGRRDFPAIGPTSEGRGELAGGDVQAVRFNKKHRRPNRHDQRTPLPGDPSWRGRYREEER